MTKAGYAAIIGRPNVGKSTLLNCILGTNLSIITSKPQTTRKRVSGIYSSDKLQIIFLDTPGIIHPKYELQRLMMESVNRSLREADIIVAIFDTGDFNYKSNSILQFNFRLLQHFSKPIIAVINKIDLIKNEESLQSMINTLNESGIFLAIVPVSALMKTNIENLMLEIGYYLPESDFLFDPEYISTQPDKFFVSEIIRECIFSNFRQEVPYSTEVVITDFKEREQGKWFISADIIVEKSTQKGIIIGKGGSSLKTIGEDSRKKIEDYLKKEVFLYLFVKVRQNWRNNKAILKSLGF